METGQKSRSFGIGGYKGRIIFLGDGTEVLTDSDDAEMFDNVDEDKDLDSQVSKSNSGEGEETNDGHPPQAPSQPANEKKSGESTETETKTEPATKDTPATETKTEKKKEEEAKTATSATTKD